MIFKVALENIYHSSFNTFVNLSLDEVIFTFLY
jgi:hypothetical protein